MTQESTFVSTSKSCGCGLQDSAYAESEAEKEAAEKTANQTVEEAKKYSNPEIPLPLKITGLAILVYLITR